MPYADAEIVYDWHHDKFKQLRYDGGMEWAVTHFFTLEAYYETMLVQSLQRPLYNRAPPHDAPEPFPT